MKDAGRPRPVLRVRRSLPASPEEVFSAWTDADSLKHWISPYGTASATVDPRVGGRFRITMLGEGREIEHTGEYREFDPPRRLVFTWCSEYTGQQTTLVTVSLRPQGHQTELVLTHELLPDEAIDSHQGGWTKIIDMLVTHLQSVRRPDGSQAPGK